MEEDIDIEEHDLLDDPRIKSIFPDLSLVKIEVPDDEHMEVQNEIDGLRGDEAESRVLYQNDYNCVTDSAYNEMDDQETEYNEETHQGTMHLVSALIDSDNLSNVTDVSTVTDGYPSNFIVLGKKPSYETLYEEALNSQTMVCLEDWGVRLSSNPCYCNLCSTLFPTVNSHDAHKMVSHSYLVAVVNTARKSTGKNIDSAPHKRQCNHCNLAFDSDTALICHLYELLPVSDNDTSVASATKKQKQEVSVASAPYVEKVKNTVNPPKLNVGHKKKFKYVKKTDTNRYIYKCRSCNEVLTTDYHARVHRKVYHPNHRAGTTLYERDVKKPLHFRNIRGKVTELSLVPKSVLFQCSKCTIHYLSVYSTLRHYKMCFRGTACEKCSVCHRKIVKRDITNHERQHEVASKLKIYTMTDKSLYARVLCKCPKCSVCFDEMSFSKHSKACTEVDFVRCVICEQNVYDYVYKTHLFRHQRMHFGRKDFIVLEFFEPKDAGPRIKSLNEPTAVRPKPLPPGSLTKMKTKSGKIMLYYCHHCMCCQIVPSAKYHLDLSCKRRRKRLCEKCGLVFSISGYLRHRLLHNTKNVDLNDFVFFNLITGATISPPINNPYICKSCDIRFVQFSALHSHVCHSDYKICEICNEKFHLKAYPVHRKFHGVTKEIKPKLIPKCNSMPKLIQKYNAIPSTWNIIFMCFDCHIVNASYDMAVEHCQRHIVGLPNDYVICKICKMSIEGDYYNAHNNLHTTNPKINKDSFKILKYKHANIFKDSWMTVFNGLSDRDVKLILSKSVYKDTRLVKMNVISESADIKYCCSNCKTSIDDVATHLNKKCEVSAKYSCKYCKVKTETLNGLVEHENRHEYIKKKYKVVTFNDSKDNKYNLKLKRYAASGFVSKLKNIPVESKNKKYKLYCCNKCSVCINTLRGTYSHVRCISNNHRRFCNICDCYFSYQNFPYHKTDHQRYPNLNRETLMISYFNSKHANTQVPKTDDKVKTTATIYKCGCGLHFTSIYTVKTHLKWPCNEKKWSKANCSKCNLVFPTDILVSHLCKHHSGDSTKLVVKNVITRNLTQCCDCKVIFSHKSDVQRHDCDRKHGMKCTKCGNLYAKTCYRKHNCIENEKEVYIDRINRAIGTKQIVLYRCETCSIHFVSMKAFKAHTKSKHKFCRAPIKCKICGLLLTQHSFRQHNVVHRSDVYTMKVMLSGSGAFIDVKGKNAIARDKNVRRSVRRADDSNEDVSSSIGEVGIDTIAREATVRRSVRRADYSTTDGDKPITAEIEPISNKMKGLIGNKRYNNRLFRCVECGQHYLKYVSLVYHFQNHKADIKQYPCELCGLNFSFQTLRRHKYIHHEKMRLELEDFDISTYDLEGNKVKGVRPITDNASEVVVNNNDVIEITDSVQDKNVSGDTDIDSENNDTEVLGTENDNNAVSAVLDNANNVSGVTDNGIVEETDVSQVTISENDVSEVNDNDNSSRLANDEIATELNRSLANKIRYFKCGECNVCFVKQNECINHVNNHCLIDPKQYICCKLCDFQFMIGSLTFHMETHHDNDFKLDNLLIEEYTQVGDNLGTKIDVYIAADRVQSRLVSTTTDEKA